MALEKLTAFTKLISSLADKPNMSATDLKAYFDNSPEELRIALNNLIDGLKAIADGDSGADNIGATAITPQSGETVQAILEYLKTQIDNVALNNVPDGSVTKAKLSISLQAALDEDYKIYKTNKDSNDIFTTVEHKRSDETLAVKSVLSGGVSPKYTTRTITFYATDGITVEKTLSRTLTYDSNGILISEA